MEAMFFVVFDVYGNRQAHLPGNTEEADLNDGCLGEFWGGTEAVFDVPVNYGEELQ